MGKIFIPPTQQKLHEEHLARQKRLWGTSKRSARVILSYRAPERVCPFNINMKLPEPLDLQAQSERFYAEEGVKARARINDIQEVVLEYYGISRSEMLSSRRSKRPLMARTVGIYLAKLFLKETSNTQIARYFNRDRCMVGYTIEKAQHLIKTRPLFATEMGKLAAAVLERARKYKPLYYTT